MASKYLQKFPVPTDFPEILHDLTREILRDQPDDILAYCALYFECLHEGKAFNYVSNNQYNIPRTQQINANKYQQNKQQPNQVNDHQKNSLPHQQLQVQNDQNPQTRVSSGTSTNTVGIAKRVSMNYTNNLYSSAINQEISIDDQQIQDDQFSQGNESQNNHQNLDLDNFQSGDLQVNIVGVQNLYAEDEEEAQLLNVYALVFPSNNPNTMIKTDTISGSINPQFNFQGKLVLNLTEEDKQDIQLIVQVFDQSDKTILGETQIDLYELLQNPGQQFDKEQNLQSHRDNNQNAGTIKLQLSWFNSHNN